MAKTKKYITLTCDQCQKEFVKSLRIHKQGLCHNLSKKNFCSKICQSKFYVTKQEVECKQCGIKFFKLPNKIYKFPNHFCSQSCAATFNNTHKTYGTRVSKFEKHVQEQLLSTYPELEFHFNRKDAINSELDIFIPELKLAFEFNGIFHYEPIYGSEKLDQIQNNDQRKFQACYEAGISLCIFDISGIKYFKPEKVIPFLEKMEEIIAQTRLSI